jgi:hypothetical protein
VLERRIVQTGSLQRVDVLLCHGPVIADPAGIRLIE